MDLYSFFNSSTSYRVRIALALKGVDTEYHGVNIRTGEHCVPEYVAETNPSACVPAIVEKGFSLGQSLAIIDWLDSAYPEPRLIPMDPVRRARVLEFSQVIASDIHPVNNLRVLKYLQDALKVTPEQKQAWYQHWVDEGMNSVERLLLRSAKEYAGPWTFGDSPSLADCCLIPQIANALRMNCNLSKYPEAMRVYEHATSHPAFVKAEPSNQPDYISP
ncbi:maleylacetoacetate isomerase [Marinobacter pelagius]|uniref:maleylacetoacetate isomerase n=1 Tax=Marinobacter sp. C7 TaxID=2951363 RepID=UPI001EF03B16|nr:maleylacetoacetate isomerase [Marinobacter sp. C7]